jgi:hypothetical protein
VKFDEFFFSNICPETSSTINYDKNRWCFWWRSLKERDNLGDPGVDRRIILRWIFRKLYVVLWTGSIWIGTDDGHL